VGPSITKNQGIVGQGVDLNLEHLEDMRRSTLLLHITKRLLYTKWRDPGKEANMQLFGQLKRVVWRDPGKEANMQLFGQLKRVVKKWLDNCLVCKGGTYPAQLMYQELADMACERITAGINRSMIDKKM